MRRWMRATTPIAAADFSGQCSWRFHRGRRAPPRERQRSFVRHAEARKEFSYFLRIGVARVGEAPLYLGALFIREFRVGEISQPIRELLDERLLGLIG